MVREPAGVVVGVANRVRPAQRHNVAVVKPHSGELRPERRCRVVPEGEPGLWRAEVPAPNGVDPARPEGDERPLHCLDGHVARQHPDVGVRGIGMHGMHRGHGVAGELEP